MTPERMAVAVMVCTSLAACANHDRRGSAAEGGAFNGSAAPVIPDAERHGPFVASPAARVPRGNLPPLGMCRIWYPDPPPGYESPSGRCEELRHYVPPGAVLLRESRAAPPPPPPSPPTLESIPQRAVLSKPGATRRSAEPPTDRRDLVAPSEDRPLAVERAADFALALVGIPYHFGGSSPSTGFDCSGLVQFSFREADIALPRMTGQQRDASSRIPLSSLQRGDLLFFHLDGKRNSHVAIYLGEGYFVHAPSSGKQVRTDRLDSTYWRSQLSEARRVAG
jgi:cell wall-associated NlpC family hydrolase